MRWDETMLNQAIAAADRTTVEQMLLDGRAIGAPFGMLAEVLNVCTNTVTIRLLEGPNSGRVCVIPSEWARYIDPASGRWLPE
jgi:hypothetical protein